MFPPGGTSAQLHIYNNSEPSNLGECAQGAAVAAALRETIMTIPLVFPERPNPQDLLSTRPIQKFNIPPLSPAPNPQRSGGLLRCGTILFTDHAFLISFPCFVSSTLVNISFPHLAASVPRLTFCNGSILPCRQTQENAHSAQVTKLPVVKTN